MRIITVKTFRLLLSMQSIELHGDKSLIWSSMEKRTNPNQLANSYGQVPHRKETVVETFKVTDPTGGASNNPHNTRRYKAALKIS